MADNQIFALIFFVVVGIGCVWLWRQLIDTGKELDQALDSEPMRELQQRFLSEIQEEAEHKKKLQLARRERELKDARMGLDKDDEAPRF